jgi:copper/silver efflux system protein
LILPAVFAAIFVLLYMLFASIPENLILLFPCAFALSGALLLQYLMGFNFSVAVAVGYIDLFGIAVETGVRARQLPLKSGFEVLNGYMGLPGFMWGA